MASADFSRFVVTACPCGLALETSPVMDVFFPSYTSLIYSESSEQLWDFVLFCRLIHSHKPWYQVSVRRVRCLPTASFRFHLAMDTLAFGYSLPTVRAAWGLAPVRIRSCWANNKKSHCLNTGNGISLCLSHIMLLPQCLIPFLVFTRKHSCYLIINGSSMNYK